MGERYRSFERLLSRIGRLMLATVGAMKVTQRPRTELNQLVRSAQVEWERLEEPGVTGAFVKVLRFDETGRSRSHDSAAFQVGAVYPAHNYPGAPG
jgi:hypothetical protein